MYSISELKELIAVLDKSSLTDLEITGEKGDSVKLSKKICVTAAETAVSYTAQQPEVGAPAAEAAQAAPEKADELTITAPTVGVFYAAASPDSEPFVKVGQKVNKGDTVCIIEAMKLMNEITAEKSGTVSEICVNNGDVIEYGQTLFKLC